MGCHPGWQQELILLEGGKDLEWAQKVGPAVNLVHCLGKHLMNE